MKKLIVDMRGVDIELDSATWADCPARVAIENALLDYQGKVVRVQITSARKSRKYAQPWVMEEEKP